MSCECILYSCLKAITANCEAIIIDLEANETGVWVMRYEFNGRWFERDISVTSGDDIEIPNIFNENYTHTLEFYNTEGDLFNDTCYALDTAKLALSDGGDAPTPPNNAVDYLAYIVTDGIPRAGLVDIGNNVMGKEVSSGADNFTDNRLIGVVVTSCETLNQPFNQSQFVKLKASNQFTLTGIILFDGQILILYTA